MHPIFHNKKKLSLALIIGGALFCVLPVLLTNMRGLDANIFCFISHYPARALCKWGQIEVKHFVGIGVTLIAAGIFVRWGTD